MRLTTFHGAGAAKRSNSRFAVPFGRAPVLENRLAPQMPSCQPSSQRAADAAAFTEIKN